MSLFIGKSPSLCAGKLACAALCDLDAPSRGVAGILSATIAEIS